MAFKLADRFKQDPDRYIRMPIAKLMFYIQGLRVLDGEIIPERLLDREDEEMLEFMTEHKEDFLVELNEMLQEVDEEEYVGGLYKL